MSDSSPAMPEAAPAKAKEKTDWAAELRGFLWLILAVLGFHSLIAKPFYIPSESMMPGLLVGDQLIVTKFPYGWSYISPTFHVLPFMHGRLFGRMPARGDVVIATPPDTREDYIKRVIGLPGDVIEVKGGRLWLNRQPVPTQDLGMRLIPIDGNTRCDATDPDPERAFPFYAGARVMGQDGKPYCRVHVLRETLPGGATYDTLDFAMTSGDYFGPYVVPAGKVFLMGDNRDDSADSRFPVSEKGLGGAVPWENIGGRAEFITFSLNGTATWNPLTWFGDFRGGRAGTSLRPVIAK